MALQPIIFRRGEENGIVIERKDFANSLFIEQYKRAIMLFCQIWEQQKTKNSDSDFDFDNRFSNIIAFCGDRGEGKSSCMTSFAKLITDTATREEAQKVLDIPLGYREFAGLELLSPIDPSFFDEQHNILELLIGRLYEQMTIIIKKEMSNDAVSCCSSELQKCFQKVQTSMKTLEKSSRGTYDTLEEISDLAASIRLRQEIDKLFVEYLKFVGKANGKLIICIDDIDLNMSQAYEMSEYIRKFLVNQHCIILVAVKIEQLTDAIASVMSKKLSDKIISKAYCEQMAQQYVTKLLPMGNRIQMPTPLDFCARQLIIKDNNGKSADIDESRGEKPVQLKEYVVRLIFKKTGYVFYNVQGVSPIVPLNLRQLRHLIATLENTEDAVQYTNSSKIDSEQGREFFNHYFFYTWTNILQERDKEFILQLNSYNDKVSLNKFVVDYFSERVENDKLFSQIEDNRNKLYALYLSIIKKNNVAANVSFGDVMFILWWVNKMTMDSDIKNLIFWLRSYYSMLLYSCYNDISREFIEPEIENTLYPSTTAEISIHKADVLYNHVNSLQRLINGSYFTYPQGFLLPKSGQNSIPRDHKVVTLKEIKKLFLQLANYDINDNSIQYLNTLRLCEYVALNISRTAYNDEKETDLWRNRTSLQPTYLGPINENSNYAVYDFLLPFYSLCNIKYAYNRFDSLQYPNKDAQELEILQGDNISDDDNILNQYSLYNRAKANDKSLLNKMLSGIETDDYHDNQMHSLISDAVLRVADVQWAILDLLIYSRNLHKSQSSDTRKIIDAYKDIQNQKIRLYSDKETELDSPERTKDSYNISFKFLTPIIKFLDGTLDGNRDNERYQQFNQMFENLFMSASMDVNPNDKMEIEQIFQYAWDKIEFPVKGEHAVHILSNSTGKKGTAKSSLTKRLNKVLGVAETYESKEALINKLANKISYITKE